ncbi:MAG: SPFH domain-containing protein [Bdellovibrionales bacterium]|nr:SPFH domain-containing protein [Bdellovibrionales bacterium]
MQRSSKLIKVLVLVLLSFSLSGCDFGWTQLGATEYGVKFRKLPPFMGGGVSESVISPGELVLLFPWDSVYKIDTSVKDISWGDKLSKDKGQFVYTRALDGNEVALAVTVRYKVKTDPKSLLNLIKNVAVTNKEIEDLVIAVARADMRTYMNELRTSEFLAKEPRYKAVDKVRQGMADKLEPLGIEIPRVNLDDFQFERLLLNGTIDSSYQETLKEIQRVREETERERSRINTVKAKKSQEFNDEQEKVNRFVAEADGYKKQASYRGDAYRQAKINQAKAVLAKGHAEVEGIKERINALSGPGGEALVKLELVKELLKNNPKFVLMSPQNSPSELRVNKIDTNSLLEQIGLIEAYKSNEEKKLNEEDNGTKK